MRARCVPVIGCPTTNLRIELFYHFSGTETSTLLLDNLVDLGQKTTHVFGRRLQQKLLTVAMYVLAQKIEAVFDMRDVGFLVGEFKTPLLQEMCHERSYFVTEKFLRRAGNDEVIRIADQVDLIPFTLPARSAKALVQQRFQSIQSPIRQSWGANPSLRCSFPDIPPAAISAARPCPWERGSAASHG